LIVLYFPSFVQEEVIISHLVTLQQSLKQAVQNGKVPMHMQLEKKEDQWNDDKTLKIPALLCHKHGSPCKHP